MRGAAIDREVSECQDFFIIMQTDYIITTNHISSVSRAKLHYTIKTFAHPKL